MAPKEDPADAHLEWLSPTPEEIEAISNFREEAPELTAGLFDGMLLRFLRARKLSIKKASKMLAAHIKWRDEVKPEAVSQGDISTSLPSGCWRVMGRSEDGSPVLWVQVSKWNPHQYSFEEYQNYVAYFVHHAETMFDKSTQYAVIFDMAGWGLWMARYLSYINRLVKIAQDHYPERLRTVLLLNTPMLFRASWALIKPWLDAKTAAKVHFIRGKKALLENMDAISFKREMIPTSLGGDCEDVIPIPNIMERQMWRRNNNILAV